MDKHEIAALFDEIGVLLELQGENPFKIRAYHHAARVLENLEDDLQLIVNDGMLQDVPGIGASLAEKIAALVVTGHLPYYEELKKSIPEGLMNLFKIPGLGGKKIKELYDALGIKSVDELYLACQRGEIAYLPHFGEKSQENILKEIEKLKTSSKRYRWWHAMQLAQPIYAGLKQLKEVNKVEIAGSTRRKMETIGDLDFLVSSSSPELIMEWFTGQPWVDSVLAKGTTKSSIRLKKGIQVDLRVVTEEQFGFALLHFTGSKEHNVKIRQIANALGYTLNEYGLIPLEENQKSPFSKRSKTPVSEENIYKVLGMRYIPPELREDRGEVEAAERGTLPKLVEDRDIRGVFHCHTTESDGHNTLEEMIAASQGYGWEYFGIADHSKSSVQAHGLQAERLFDQIERIHALNRSGKYAIHVFAGLECDVMVDGELDFPDDVLKRLDYVVASIHRSFNLDEKTMTARLIKAIENPYTTIVGHVTGRLLLKRDPYKINVPKVIDACIANNTLMELNANPMRLDMDWRYWHQAAEKGLVCCINPDAHSTADLEFYRAGVNVARKGWLEKTNVFNTRPLAEIKAYLANKK